MRFKTFLAILVSLFFVTPAMAFFDWPTDVSMQTVEQNPYRPGEGAPLYDYQLVPDTNGLILKNGSDEAKTFVISGTDGSRVFPADAMTVVVQPESQLHLAIQNPNDDDSLGDWEYNIVVKDVGSPDYSGNTGELVGPVYTQLAPMGGSPALLENGYFTDECLTCDDGEEDIYYEDNPETGLIDESTIVAGKAQVEVPAVLPEGNAMYETWNHAEVVAIQGELTGAGSIGETRVDANEERNNHQDAEIWNTAGYGTEESEGGDGTLEGEGESRIDLNEAKNVEQDDRLDGHDELIGDIIEVQGLQAQDIEDQQDQLDNHEGRITTLEQDVAGLMDDVDRNKAGIAAAVATASLQFAPDHPGLQMAIGGGSYRGEQATALGIGGRLSKHVFVNANAGYTTEDDWTVGAGLTVLFSPAN
jgi:hypothetical protein